MSFHSTWKPQNQREPLCNKAGLKMNPFENFQFNPILRRKTRQIETLWPFSSCQIEIYLISLVKVTAEREFHYTSNILVRKNKTVTPFCIVCSLIGIQLRQEIPKVKKYYATLALTQPPACLPLGRMRERIRWARKIIHKGWDERSVISVGKKKYKWVKQRLSLTSSQEQGGGTDVQSVDSYNGTTPPQFYCWAQH